MKNKIKLVIATFLLSVFCLSSCTKKGNLDTSFKQDVTFSFEQKDLGIEASTTLKSATKEDSRYIVVTIENSYGKKVYESKKLDLYNFSGSFITQPISLEDAGSPYKVTQFLVLDENFKVIFATPIKDSKLAYLITEPLPVKFTVNKKISKVILKVLLADLIPMKDFGYVSFDFDIITPVRFLMRAQDYNPITKTFQRINAKVLITGNPGNVILYNDSITAISDTIKVKDGYLGYKISVSKRGYIAKDTTLTNAQLKTYLNSPILFSLQRETVTDVDGNVYKTVTIGKQVWMVENLKVTHYRNGQAIPYLPTVEGDPVIGTITTDGYFNSGLYEINLLGKIYNWKAVTDSRNIAPKGWHVPTNADWTTLTTYLGGESIAGDKLKESGTEHWLSPNAGATNETGFTALPFNIITFSGSLQYPEGQYGYWWTSSKDPISGDALFRKMFYNRSFVQVGTSPMDTNDYYYMSVRCIKD